MNRAAELLDAAQAVLLDFDGPVTALMPPPANLEAADEARAPLLARGIFLDDDIATTSDHLAVLRWAARNALDALPDVEKRCDDAETASALAAEPTRGTADLLVACREARKPVVIVSNNAERAIRAYLERWSLTPYVAAIFGRPVGRPALMKPETYSLARALSLLRVEAGQTVLIGDSLSDVEASHAAGLPCIGYAKTSSRGVELTNAGADAVIESIDALVAPGRGV